MCDEQLLDGLNWSLVERAFKSSFISTSSNSTVFVPHQTFIRAVPLIFIT